MKIIRYLIFIGLVSSLAAAAGLAFRQAYAKTESSNLQPAADQQDIGNEACLVCHGQADQYYTLPSGDELYLTIDEAELKASVHGQIDMKCTDCHTTITGYPHPITAAITRRDATLELYPSCAQCHQEMYDAALDSVHQKALAGGNEEAAVCTDCHGAHNVQVPDVPRTHIPQTCERCHSQIYSLYKDSVHGEALIGEGNPDVPTCIDCHGVHNVSGPATSQFHLFSPLICADCHADSDLMNKYDVSTNVFESYISDFHGTTVTLFEELAPGQETNKPVCIDCHGAHDIRSADNPDSTVIKENLLNTCQKCHPDATANFPSSWLSHYEPSTDKYPIVYYVNLFYKIFIPGVLGGMGLFVLGDAARKFIFRRKEASHG